MPLPDIKPEHTLKLNSEDVDKILKHYFEEVVMTGRVERLSFDLTTDYGAYSTGGERAKIFSGITVRFTPTIDLLKR